jgi:ADP-ribosylglycohydrolase
MFEVVLAYAPEGDTRAGIARAATLPLSIDIASAASTFGNGSKITSQDTVPYVLWCAARHLGAFEEAMWSTGSGLGDRDTTCAMVGGIVALHPAAEIPPAWLEAREAFDVMSLGRPG